MTDAPRPGPGASPSADPTRDIRLRALPGRPMPPLPPGWLSPDRSDGPSVAETAEPGSGLEVDQPTDELGHPPEGSRDPTLTFEGSAAQRWQAGLGATPDPAWSPLPPRPGPVVGPRPRERPRRWPWIALALLPVLIIVGTGTWLLLLLRG
jgi:hypothetical protein